MTLFQAGDGVRQDLRTEVEEDVGEVGGGEFRVLLILLVSHHISIRMLIGRTMASFVTARAFFQPEFSMRVLMCVIAGSEMSAQVRSRRDMSSVDTFDMI